MNQKIIEKARSLGFRITPTLKNVLGIFENSKAPVSVPDLTSHLKVNKTTIYREIETLVKRNLLIEVDFADGLKRYELSNIPHHHHLICLSCKKVDDINFEENLGSQEREIEKSRRFKITRHNLEFFGYCFNCR